MLDMNLKSVCRVANLVAVFALSTVIGVSVMTALPAFAVDPNHCSTSTEPFGAPTCPPGYSTQTLYPGDVICASCAPFKRWKDGQCRTYYNCYRYNARPVYCVPPDGTDYPQIPFGMQPTGHELRFLNNYGPGSCAGGGCGPVTVPIELCPDVPES